MLPDFPTLKLAALKKAHLRIRQLERQKHPILNEIKSFTQHEGRQMNFQQVGYGRKSQEAVVQEISVSVSFTEIPNLVGPALDAKLALLAEQSGGTKVKMLIEKATEAADMTGQRIDAQGKPPTGALLLDVMEAAEGSFNEEGTSELKWLIHPDSVPALEKASREVDDDPGLRARRESILQRQRAEWIARENRRKLVS